MFSFSALWGIYAEGQDVQQVVVAVEEAGMLPDKVGTAKNVIKNLKVVGDLNGKDIRFLREMAGVAFNGDEIETGSLVDLDLSEANIVEGERVLFIYYFMGWNCNKLFNHNK